MPQINLLDMALVILLLFFTIKGLLRGFVQEMAVLLGVVVGIALARSVNDQFSPLLEQCGISPQFASMLSAAILFLTGIIVIGFLARGLHRILESAFAGGIDRILGFVAGLAKGILFTGVVGYIAIRLVPDADVVQQSQILPPLMQIIQAVTGSINLYMPAI